MERVLARHPADPEGAVLRLAWQAGLSREEIAGLTWPQVDLDGQRPVPVRPHRAAGGRHPELPPQAP